MIAIIDYGMGNLRSVQKGFEKVGHEAVITSDPATIDAAERVVLPGVGAFGDAMHELRERGLVDVTRRAAHSGRPFLGICLGLQLLFDVSYEGGRYEGLGILGGEVVRLPRAKDSKCRTWVGMSWPFARHRLCSPVCRMPLTCTSCTRSTSFRMIAR